MKRLPTLRALQITSLLAVAITLGSPAIAMAHVLKEDNGISSVLHIDPDDNPVAGVKTNLELQFGNSAGNFSLNDYQLAVTVTENNKTIQKAPVTAAYFGSASEGVATVTFPRIDVYQVIVSGTATTKAAASFSVDYLVRVASGTNASQSSQGNSTTVVLLSATSLILLIMIAGYQIAGGKRYVARKQK